MGTPGDKFPIDKVAHGVPLTGTASSTSYDQTEEPPDIVVQSPTMTILQSIPSLGIFVEQSHREPQLPIPMVRGPSLSLHTLEDLEKQLLIDATTSESDNSSSNVPLLVDNFTNPPPAPEAFFKQVTSPQKSTSIVQELSLQASTSHKSSIVIDELSLPGPSGLQTPKTTKPSSTLVKIAPKRNKKPPLSSQTPKKTHICSICNKNFQTSAKLTSHQIVHSGSTPFKCEHCKKTFSSKFKLVRHVLIHSDRKPFSCTVCERTFHRKDHLKNHIKVHSPSKKVYACEKPNCKKEYTSVMSYRKHLALHSAEEGSLECKICSKLFETKADIMYHLKIHAGSRTVKNPNEKKFTCDYCDRKFFTRKDVRRHLVVHTGSRNFLCQFCPQRFGRKDHLVRHIKKSHSRNYTEIDSTSTDATSVAPLFEVSDLSGEPSYSEVKQEISQLEVESILDYSDDKNEIKLEELPGVQNLLFSRSFTELSPMLCSEPEPLPFITHAGSESDLLPQTQLPSDSELLSELDVIKSELEQGIVAHEVVGTSAGLIEVESDLELQSQQLLPSDMMDSDLLRLIGEGGNQLTDDENNLPLPGFSQVFKQQEPPS